VVIDAYPQAYMNDIISRRLQRSLKEVFGLERLRPLQRQVIERVREMRRRISLGTEQPGREGLTVGAEARQTGRRLRLRLRHRRAVVLKLALHPGQAAHLARRDPPSLLRTSRSFSVGWSGARRPTHTNTTVSARSWMGPGSAR